MEKQTLSEKHTQSNISDNPTDTKIAENFVNLKEERRQLKTSPATEELIMQITQINDDLKELIEQVSHPELLKELEQEQAEILKIQKEALFQFSEAENQEQMLLDNENDTLSTTTNEEMAVKDLKSDQLNEQPADNVNKKSTGSTLIMQNKNKSDKYLSV